MSKQIICLDFDGVIHSYTSGWKGADIIPDPPVKGVKEFLEEATEHFNVHIFSSRSHAAGGMRAMIGWFIDNFGEHLTEKLYFPAYKPAASVTIDDRAITFTGMWPSMKTLRNFKPWHKKD